MKRLRFGAAALAVLAITACGGDAGSIAPSTPGMVEIVLDASDDSTGALVVSVTGGRVDSVGAAPVTAYTEARANGVNVFVAGVLPNGSVVARVYVPDAARIGDYHIAGVEAANNGTFAQRAPGTWQVRARTN